MSILKQFFTGLSGLETLPEPKPVTPTPVEQPKINKTKPPQPENKSFVKWFEKAKPKLAEEFPDMDSKQLTKTAFEKFKEESSPTESKKSSEDETNKKIALADHKENVNTETSVASNKNPEDEVSRKRKLNGEQNDENNQPKRTASASKLAAFARTAK